SEAMDFNGRNEQTYINIGPAPNGTADLALSDVQLLSTGVPGQRTYRVTISNAGPAALDATAEAPLSIEPSGAFGATWVATSSSDPRFSCYELYPNCDFTGSIAAGESTSIDFTIESSFAPEAEFYVLLRVPAITPDHDVRNNERDLLAPELFSY
ncbi:MAG TPA: hypothetical protein VK524_31555, partial [Polyangiaceae bacterium]|nr:hypothetical protein [Polyangiaceae bacterium]